MKTYGILVVVVVVVVASAVAVVAMAQNDKKKSRLASTKQIMSGLVHPSHEAIEKMAKEMPVDAKAWDALATSAALLNEASYLLMEDGRCLDGDWEKASQNLRTGSAAVLAKIQDKDRAGVDRELKAMTQACVACHAAHRQ
ncbi:MAG: hypothetical protein U1A77_08590 [Pirellulales bacterium]